MSDGRPNPDALLARLQSESEEARPRGRFKIFLGMCAGVGKTYAMLEAGRVRGIEGRDVLVGVVETHGRGETEQLLLGLDLMPRHQIEYRGVALREFDLDACLARRPDLVLVDELAHTNAPGSRHQKRYQDVQELLAAGIDVYSTLNIQHIESFNDVVAQITGVVVRETVPDSILDLADEIELVDLPPEELLQRLREGKVYLGEKAQLAAENFFKHGNLIALRELALRFVAERVDRQMQEYRRGETGAPIWPVRERLLVCVSAAPQSARLVRATRRLATRLGAEWLAVHIDTPRSRRLSAAERDRLHRILRLAEQLGAEIATISGSHAAQDLVSFARSRNVTKIVIGKSGEPRWKRLLLGSMVDDIAARSGEIDLYVISGEGEQAATATRPHGVRVPRWKALLWTPLAVAACTGFCTALRPWIDEANVAMLFLVCVVGVALAGGRLAGLAASLLSVAAYDYFFVAPLYELSVLHVRYGVTFFVMLLVALLISNLAVQIQEQAETARRREARTNALYGLTRRLADIADREPLLAAAAREIQQNFDCAVTFFTPDEAGTLTLSHGVLPRDAGERETAVATWVFENEQRAGLGTHTLPSALALYLPLEGSQEVVGVLGVSPGEAARLQDPDELNLLETFSRQTALALERVSLAEEANRAQVQVETERLRTALLNSVSHDFRSPLEAIMTAAAQLLRDEASADAVQRRDLAESIRDEADRLDRLIGNLLDMTRLESGAIPVRRESCALADLVDAALHRLRRPLATRAVSTHVPAELPPVRVDPGLIEQVFVNLLENAVKHTPADTPIEISAENAQGVLRITVADRGPGLPGDAIPRIFEKFFRAAPGEQGGVGLGLAICDAIIRSHGGRIWAVNRPEGGAAFHFTLPAEGWEAQPYEPAHGMPAST
jgi:two-component system sensor histidine kinase KdpD